MALQNYNLTNSFIDSSKEITDNSSNKMGCIGEYTFQVKNEVDLLDTSKREYTLKQTTEASNFHFEPIKKEIDPPVNMYSDVKDCKDGIYCATFKQELEDEVQYPSESCLNVQGATGSSSINLDFHSRYDLQMKSEVGFDNDLRECNLKQETESIDIKQFKKEAGGYNIMEIYIKNDTRDEIQVRDGQSREKFINIGETYNNNYFQNHSKTDDNESKGWFQCNLCEFKSKYRSNLKAHIEYKHNISRKDSPEIYQCQFCEFKSKYKHDLNRHTYYKHNENPKMYRCSFCDYETKHRSSLVCHTNCKHSESPKWYQCNFCDYKTKYKSSLMYHFKMQHNETSEVHQCSFCEYKSKDKNILQKHVNFKHGDGVEIYQCQFCEEKYQNKKAFKRHIDYMHNENVEWHQCDHCNYKTKYRQDLRNHVKAKHDKSCKVNQ